MLDPRNRAFDCENTQATEKEVFAMMTKDVTVFRVAIALGGAAFIGVAASETWAVPWRAKVLTKPGDGIEAVPSASDVFVVWHRDLGGTTDKEIMVHDGSRVVPLTQNLVDDVYANALGRRIVWSRWDGNDYELWYFDAANGLPGRIDGLAEPILGSAVSVQNTQTQFGNSTLGQTGPANGSELDGAYGSIIDGVLYLVLAGNLESNFNPLEIFIDSIDGQGQNRLLGNNPNVDSNGLNRMGDSGSGNGLRFDSGFAPDYYLTFSGGGSPYMLHGSYAELLTAGGGTGYYLGSTAAVSDGDLTGGNNPHGVRVTIDNRNTAGVSSGTGAGSGAGVLTGLEFSIPLSALGNPTGPVRICAFINGVTHSFVSNQVLGPIGGGANLGDPRNVNFGSVAGNQFFTVAPALAGPTQITNNNYNDQFTVIAGNYIVWSAWDGGDEEIFVFDGATVTQLTNNNDRDLNPHTDGNWIVWQRNEGGNDSEVMVFDGISSFAITNDTVRNDYPKVSNGEIVYNRFAGGGWNIFHWSEGVTTQWTTSGTEKFPVISNGYAAWRSTAFSVQGDVVFYDGSATNVTQDHRTDEPPMLSNSLMVWEGQHRTLPGRDEIFAYRGHGIEQVSPQENGGIASGQQYSLHGNRIAWRQGILDIWLAVPGVGGDMDCNDVLDLSDLDRFVLALLDPAGYMALYPGCPITMGDFNFDGKTDGADIRHFILALLEIL